MRPSIGLLALSLFILGLSSGCASMMNKGKQSLTINSSPSGAIVYENGAVVGTTPYSYTYERQSGENVTIELRMDGRQPASLDLHPRKCNAVLFADAMLLGIPYIADGKSAALYSFPRPDVSVNLYRSRPTDRQQLELPVATLENAIGAKEKLGNLGPHALTLASKELADLRYPETAMSSLLRGMDGSYVDASSVRLNTTKGNEAVQRAKLVLRPLLKGVHMQLEEVQHRAYGTVSLDMDWRFYSGVDKDSLLFTMPGSTTWSAYAVPSRDVLLSALQDAAHQLIDEDSLYERISAVRSIGLARSKGSDVHLTTPRPIAFTGRKDMISALVTGVVTVETKDGHGSGFLITNDGNIITNAHVVGDQATVKVKFEQGFSLDGQVVKVNRDFDVALIKVAGNDLPALSMGDDAGLQLGEELFAIGTPLDEDLGQTVTRGIMSGRREFEGRKYLQTDVSINPGNSGGPLIDENGKVVGVATMKVEATGIEGIGFGVPISVVLEMLNIDFTKP
jgi:S1-C subfamily serine protease